MVTIPRDELGGILALPEFQLRMADRSLAELDLELDWSSKAEGRTTSCVMLL